MMTTHLTSLRRSGILNNTLLIAEQHRRNEVYSEMVDTLHRGMAYPLTLESPTISEEILSARKDKALDGVDDKKPTRSEEIAAIRVVVERNSLQANRAARISQECSNLIERGTNGGLRTRIGNLEVWKAEMVNGVIKFHKREVNVVGVNPWLAGVLFTIAMLTALFF